MEQEKSKILQQIPDSNRNNIVCIEVVYKTKLSSHFLHIQNIASTNPSKVHGRAIGFFIAPSLLVTNIHVIISARSVSIKQFDVKRSKEPKLFTIEGVIAFDAMNDLVVLKVSQQCENYFPIGNSNTVKQKDRVLTYTYAEAKYRSIESTINYSSTDDGWYFINTQLSPWDTGAPILNRNGEVIGIANTLSKKMDDSIGITGYTYVIPSNTLNSIFEIAEKVEPIVAWKKRPVIRAYIEEIHANMKIKENKYKEAIVNFDTVLHLNPNLVQSYVTRGFTKSILNDYEGAISDCNAALRLNRGFVQAYTNRFTAKNNLQDYEGALDDLNILHQHFLDSIELSQLYVHRAGVKNNLGDFEGAIHDYTQALEMKSEDLMSYYNRGEIRKVLGEKNTNQGNIDEAQNLYHRAIEDYTKVIQLAPDRVNAYFRRGIVQHNLAISLVSHEKLDESANYYQKAINDYTEVIRRKYWHFTSYYNRGLAKYQLGKNESKRGNSEIAKGHYKDAIIDFDIYIPIKRKYHVNAIKNRGNVKNALGQFVDAIEDYTKTIQLDPENVSAYDNRGYIKTNLAESKAETGNVNKAQKLYLDALEDYNKAIQLTPEESKIYNRRGIAKHRLGKSLVDQGNVEEAQKYFQEAIADYSETIRQYPKYADAYNNRGNTKLSIGLSEIDHGNEERAKEYFQDAILDLDKAITLNPKFVKAYNNRGKVKNTLNMHKEAETDFSKAKDLEFTD